MVDACVATKKMTKEEQQTAEFTVSRLRTMVPDRALAARPGDARRSMHAEPRDGAEGRQIRLLQTAAEIAAARDVLTCRSGGRVWAPLARVSSADRHVPIDRYPDRNA